LFLTKIRILGFIIEKQTRIISAQTQNLNIQAVEKDIQIQDVVIHTKQIWRSKDVFIIQVFKKRTVVKKRKAIQIAINLKMK
jgi:hypothetical protein